MSWRGGLAFGIVTTGSLPNGPLMTGTGPAGCGDADGPAHPARIAIGAATASASSGVSHRAEEGKGEGNARLRSG